jgi:hypothetical protein
MPPTSHKGLLGLLLLLTNLLSSSDPLKIFDKLKSDTCRPRPVVVPVCGAMEQNENTVQRSSIM